MLHYKGQLINAAEKSNFCLFDNHTTPIFSLGVLNVFPFMCVVSVCLQYALSCKNSNKETELNNYFEMFIMIIIIHI